MDKIEDKNAVRYFNGQEILLGFRLKDMGHNFYEMLTPTYLGDQNEIRLVNQWGEYIKKKNIPFAITKKVVKREEGGNAVSIRFWVKGVKKVPPKYSGKIKQISRTEFSSITK